MARNIPVFLELRLGMVGNSANRFLCKTDGTAATGFWTIIWHTLRLDLTFAFGLLSTSFAANRKFRQQTGP